MEKFNIYIQQILSLVIAYLPKVLLAFITLVAGLWLIKWMVRAFNYTLERNNVELSLRNFLGGLINIGLKVLLVISVASMIGIATTSFVAVLGAAGLAIGLALQGSLSNFAGGVLILLLRPYRAGDYITAQGQSGTVREIQIFYTVLKTPDNKTIVIPNGKLSNDTIINFSLEPHRRVDMTFGIGYSDNIRKAKEILKSLIENEGRVLKEPPPQIIVSELAASSVNITIKVWTNTGDYWDVYYDMQEQVKDEFDSAGISIPFPQTDMHLYHHGDVPTKKFGLPAETDAPKATSVESAKVSDNTKSSQEKT